MSNYRCTGCQKNKPGRFTRRKDGSKRGWSQGGQLPHWFCYDCLPHGQGRDEDEVIDVPKATASPAALPAKINPAAVKQEGLQVIQPLAHAVDGLSLRYPDEEGYLHADNLLHRIRSARKTWGDKMEAIIRPIRQGLDNIYALNREVDKPLGALEDSVKDRMKLYKIEEHKQLRAAEEERERVAAALRREAEEKERKAQEARTAQMRGKLQAQAARAQEQAEVVEQTPAPAAVVAAGSVTRPVQKVRIENPVHFLQGMIDGYCELDCFTDPKVQDAVQTVLNRHFKADPEGLKAWPGVEVYDDIQIVGR